MHTFDVIGIGNPLLDRIADVSEESITSLELAKGTMHLIQDEDARRLATWLTSQKLDVAVFPGGSCCNSMVGVSTLGGTAAFIGAIGDDEHGNVFERELRAAGVEPFLVRYPGLTGSCHVLVTPDAERTMNTHLGASCNLSETDVASEILSRAKYLHLEGYLWDVSSQKNAAIQAMKFCSENNIPVSLDVADPFVVERYGDSFRELLPMIDIIFANEREAELFTGKPAEEAVRELGKSCSFAAVKVGSKGSLISHNGTIHKIPPFTVKAVDTTGAGDMYAGASLFALSQGYTAEQIGKLASYCSAKVVSQSGAQLATHLNPREILSL